MESVLLALAVGLTAEIPVGGRHHGDGIRVDQKGNLYVAEVDSGRFQKFQPRTGANPAYLISKPIYSAWN